jgi:hypothetical protein
MKKIVHNSGYSLKCPQSRAGSLITDRPPCFAPQHPSPHTDMDFPRTMTGLHTVRTNKLPPGSPRRSRGLDFHSCIAIGIPPQYIQSRENSLRALLRYM